MVNEITTKVFNSERNISVKNVTQPEDDGKIRVISTFEADKSIVDAVKKSEENFKLTQSFRNQNGSLFKFVKTVGPNIKSQVNNLKKQALCKDQNVFHVQIFEVISSNLSFKKIERVYILALRRA